MKNTLFALVGAMLLLTACNTNDPTKSCPVAGRTYIHLNPYDPTDTIAQVFFNSKGECKDIRFSNGSIGMSWKLYYAVQDTTITLYWDKHHKELNDYNGTFYYHDTILIRWIQNDATSDDYDTYFEVK